MVISQQHLFLNSGRQKGYETELKCYQAQGVFYLQNGSFHIKHKHFLISLSNADRLSPKIVQSYAHVYVLYEIFGIQVGFDCFRVFGTRCLIWAVVRALSDQSLVLKKRLLSMRENRKMLQVL